MSILHDITGERYAMIRPHSFCTFTAHSQVLMDPASKWHPRSFSWIIDQFSIFVRLR
jgi:hypothetical protein